MQVQDIIDRIDGQISAKRAHAKLRVAPALADGLPAGLVGAEAPLLLPHQPTIAVDQAHQAVSPVPLVGLLAGCQLEVLDVLDPAEVDAELCGEGARVAADVAEEFEHPRGLQELAQRPFSGGGWGLESFVS